MRIFIYLLIILLLFIMYKNVKKKEGLVVDIPSHMIDSIDTIDTIAEISLIELVKEIQKK